MMNIWFYLMKSSVCVGALYTSPMWKWNIKNGAPLWWLIGGVIFMYMRQCVTLLYYYEREFFGKKKNDCHWKLRCGAVFPHALHFNSHSEWMAIWYRDAIDAFHAIRLADGRPGAAWKMDTNAVQMEKKKRERSTSVRVRSQVPTHSSLSAPQIDSLQY